MAIYEALGVDPMVISMWRRCHRNWRYKSMNVKGMLDAMRLTGQATTALGNVIVNMLVHLHVCKQNTTKWAIFLGDDSLMGCDTKVDVKHMRRVIADEFNMMSKAVIRENCGVFCRQVMCNNGRCNQLGPDVIRLTWKYELYNTQTEIKEGVRE